MGEKYTIKGTNMCLENGFGLNSDDPSNIGEEKCNPP